MPVRKIEPKSNVDSFLCTDMTYILLTSSNNQISEAKIDEIFTVDLTLCSKHQIDGEDFVNFRGFLRKYELQLGKYY